MKLGECFAKPGRIAVGMCLCSDGCKLLLAVKADGNIGLINGYPSCMNFLPGAVRAKDRMDLQPDELTTLWGSDGWKKATILEVFTDCGVDGRAAGDLFSADKAVGVGAKLKNSTVERQIVGLGAKLRLIDPKDGFLFTHEYIVSNRNRLTAEELEKMLGLRWKDWEIAA